MKIKIIDDYGFVEKAYKNLLPKDFGEEKEKYILLSMYEILYLAEKNKIEDDFQSLIKYFSKYENFVYQKYIIFKFFRESGYVIKTGLKFGFDFRVYPKGKSENEAHTEYVVKVISENNVLVMNELTRMVRMAQTVKAKLLIAIVDSEGEFVILNVSRFYS